MRRPSSFRRRLSLLLAGAALLLSFAGAATALTVEVPVTPAYLRDNAKTLSLKVTRRPDGLLAFTVDRTVPDARYFVARLLIRREGKTLAETSIPSWGKKDTNRFFFALAPESLAQAEFELSESFVRGSADEPIALPGTKIFKFQLRDHVPEVLTKR
jgi:hypothetical protein